MQRSLFYLKEHWTVTAALCIALVGFDHAAIRSPSIISSSITSYFRWTPTKYDPTSAIPAPSTAPEPTRKRDRKWRN